MYACTYMYIVVMNVLYHTYSVLYLQYIFSLQTDIYKNPLYSENQHQHVCYITIHNIYIIVIVFHYFGTHHNFINYCNYVNTRVCYVT